MLTQAAYLLFYCHKSLQLKTYRKQWETINAPINKVRLITHTQEDFKESLFYYFIDSNSPWLRGGKEWVHGQNTPLKLTQNVWRKNIFSNFLISYSPDQTFNSHLHVKRESTLESWCKLASMVKAVGDGEITGGSCCHIRDLTQVLLLITRIQVIMRPQ